MPFNCGKGHETSLKKKVFTSDFDDMQIVKEI
jgi:hypothetical protein